MYEVSTGSGPGSPRGQPAWGGGCDRVSIDTKTRDSNNWTRSLPLPVLTSLLIHKRSHPQFQIQQLKHL